MITTLSWRRGDAQPVDDDGHIATQPLMAVDDGDTAVLHLREDTATEPATRRDGRLVLIVAGGGTVEIDHESVEVAAGDAVRLPPGRSHRLVTESGLSAVLITYQESRASWRVTRTLANGARWVAGVFSDTRRARDYRDRLREELDTEAVSLE